MHDKLKLATPAALGPVGADPDFKETALVFRAKRQELLASNIANVDTPGYRALDASFDSALRDALRLTDATNPKPPCLQKDKLHCVSWALSGTLSSTNWLFHRWTTSRRNSTRLHRTPQGE